MHFHCHMKGTHMSFFPHINFSLTNTARHDEKKLSPVIVFCRFSNVFSIWKSQNRCSCKLHCFQMFYSIVYTATACLFCIYLKQAYLIQNMIQKKTIFVTLIRLALSSCVDATKHDNRINTFCQVCRACLHFCFTITDFYGTTFYFEWFLSHPNSSSWPQFTRQRPRIPQNIDNKIKTCLYHLK